MGQRIAPGPAIIGVGLAVIGDAVVPALPKYMLEAGQVVPKAGAVEELYIFNRVRDIDLTITEDAAHDHLQCADAGTAIEISGDRMGAVAKGHAIVIADAAIDVVVEQVEIKRELVGSDAAFQSIGTATVRQYVGSFAPD